MNDNHNYPPGYPPSQVDPTRPWLLKEVSPDGDETWTIRVFFWSLTGPRNFGPFLSEGDAEEFMHEAGEDLEQTVGELQIDAFNFCSKRLAAEDTVPLPAQEASPPAGTA